MTLKDVREPVRIIADWCLDQDDLVGFQVQICDDAGHRLLVDLRWPNGWHVWRSFGVPELEPAFIADVLESFAAEARQRSARIADPNRLPG